MSSTVNHSAVKYFLCGYCRGTKQWLPSFTLTALHHTCTGVLKIWATSTNLLNVRRIILVNYSLSLAGQERQAVRQSDTLQTKRGLYLEGKLTGNKPKMSTIIPHYKQKQCANRATLSMVGHCWNSVSACSLWWMFTTNRVFILIFAFCFCSKYIRLICRFTETLSESLTVPLICQAFSNYLGTVCYYFQQWWSTLQHKDSTCHKLELCFTSIMVGTLFINALHVYTICSVLVRAPAL